MSIPTDDEREALRIAHLDARQTAYREDRALWFRDYDNAPEIATNAFFRGWDASVDGGFRRSEVPEPSAEDEFASGECDGSGKCSAPRHTHGCYTLHRADQCDSPDEYGHLPSEPQGEPSDAQIAVLEDELAEWVAGKRSWCDQHHGKPDEIELTARADEATIRLLMTKLAALRAAGGCAMSMDAISRSGER